MNFSQQAMVNGDDVCHGSDPDPCHDPDPGDGHHGSDHDPGHKHCNSR